MKPNIDKNTLPHLGNYKFHYFVESNNFDTLSEDEQENTLQKFFEFLTYTNTKIKFTMIHSPVNVPVGDEENKLFLAPRVYLSTNIQIDSALEKWEYEFTRVLVPPFPIIKKETRKDLTIDAGEKGVYAKCYSLSEIPKNRAEYGWIYRIFLICEMVMFEIEPIPFEISSKLLANRMALYQRKGMLKRSHQEKLENLNVIYENILAEKTVLFKLKCNVLISGETSAMLRKNEKEFRIEMRRFRGKFKAINAAQASTLYEGDGITLYIPRHVLAVFYPLISASILELPNGIPIGINTNTEEPVIIDFRKRKSTNVAVIGITGSGKSMTVKVIEKRSDKSFPERRVRIIDPSGEWLKEAKYLNLDPVVISPDDPNTKGINIFKDLTATEIASLIIEVVEPKKEIANEILAKCENVKNIQELNDRLSLDGQNALLPLLKGPISKVFQGDLDVTDRMIYSLTGMDPDAKITHMVVYLVLKRIWSEIKNLMKEENKNVVSYLIIDEAWMLWKLKSAANFINTVLRTGRKYGIIFILISQKPEDFVKSEGGDPPISQIETVFLHRLKKIDVLKIAESFGLSESEVLKIPKLKDGECIIHTDKHRVICQVTPTTKEYERFTTRRSEVTYD